MLTDKDIENIKDDINDYRRPVDRLRVMRLLDAYNDQKEILRKEEDFNVSAFRALAKEQLPRWIPWEFEEKPWESQNGWGVPGLGGTLYVKEDGSYELWVSSQKKQGLGTSVPLTYGLEAIRLSAIGALIFCEAEERRKTNE